MGGLRAVYRSFTSLGGALLCPSSQMSRQVSEVRGRIGSCSDKILSMRNQYI